MKNRQSACTERYRQEGLRELAAELREFSYDGLVLLEEDLSAERVTRGSWAGCVLSYKRGAAGSTRRDRLGSRPQRAHRPLGQRLVQRGGNPRRGHAGTGAEGRPAPPRRRRGPERAKDEAGRCRGRERAELTPGRVAFGRFIRSGTPPAAPEGSADGRRTPRPPGATIRSPARRTSSTGARRGRRSGCASPPGPRQIP